jgi:hypothetical protein
MLARVASLPRGLVLRGDAATAVRQRNGMRRY